MVRMILTYKVMPYDSEVEYNILEDIIKEKVSEYNETVTINSVEEQMVGFGLKAVRISFSIDENLGSEGLENTLKKLPEVGDIVVESMSRAMG